MIGRFEAICLLLLGFVIGLGLAFAVWPHHDLRTTLRKGAAPSEDVFVIAPAQPEVVIRERQHGK